ncbi:hypothetical protein C8P63_104160 [Melghirimyces profundicolus]|uniref:Cof subfamily protein (Haloacid dehalogenase superfamily)/HAD superfamily hydrolase (TIGR01484 family) n=1 Tax=Melghirimyces profundicolus TaxID=1242148 RepID=A0A2T6C4S9_9BACL|nr:Cof-type HAD-IIB family hydrolase [Melghirimyces profundicolus]PTX63315.1 hypothetical protein C8P63_104160 [Melghirimyces profundicolus]
MSILKYPLFVSDIDGTLVNQMKEIPEANKKTISTFRHQGGLFTLATGRSYMEAKRFIEEMDVRLPVILCNGGVIYDPATDRLQPTAAIERSMVFDALADLEKLTDILDIFIYTTDKVYATGISPQTQAQIETGEFPLELVGSYHHLPEVPWIKMVVVAEPQHMPQLHAWTETVDYPLEFVQSSENYFEILPQNVSKGNAVRQLAERFDLHPGQCAAIGDHLNDLSMVEMAGDSAAVANAHPKLIQAARRIVPSNEAAGVAHFVRHHLLAPVSQAQSQ